MKFRCQESRYPARSNRRNFLPMLSLDFGEMGRHVKRVSRLAKKIKDIKAAGPLKLLRETLSSALQIGRRVNL